MIGRLAKKPADWRAIASRSSSQAASGGDGSRTKARNDRPAKRSFERAARASDKGRFAVNNWLRNLAETWLTGS